MTHVIPKETVLVGLFSVVVVQSFSVERLVLDVVLGLVESQLFFSLLVLGSWELFS